MMITNLSFKLACRPASCYQSSFVRETAGPGDDIQVLLHGFMAQYGRINFEWDLWKVGWTGTTVRMNPRLDSWRPFADLAKSNSFKTKVNSEESLVILRSRAAVGEKVGKCWINLGITSDDSSERIIIMNVLQNKRFQSNYWRNSKNLQWSLWTETTFFFTISLEAREWNPRI